MIALLDAKTIAIAAPQFKQYLLIFCLYSSWQIFECTERVSSLLRFGNKSMQEQFKKKHS